MLFAQTTLELMTTGALLQELSWQYEYFWSVVTWFNLSTMISVGVNDFFGRKMSKAELSGRLQDWRKVMRRCVALRCSPHMKIIAIHGCRNQ